MKTAWTKYKNEEYGTLEVYVRDIVKHFVAKYRSQAMIRARAWYKKFNLPSKKGER